MGIDYVLDVSCAPKNELGIEPIVAMIKARSRADTVIAMARRQGDHRPPSELAFVTALYTPEGLQQQTVTAQSLLDQARPLDAMRHHCASCAADRKANGFGCYRFIPYPISAEAERWLLSLLPDRLDNPAGMFLVRALNDFGWDGGQAAKMRGDGNTFFETNTPIGLRWGADGDAVELDSNQVFHMLFHVGHIEPTHAFMVCLFFGIVPHNTPIEALAPDRRGPLLAAARVPQPPSEACRPVASFLESLLAAARGGVTLLIDG
jgi:hypothetical protein